MLNKIRENMKNRRVKYSTQQRIALMVETKEKLRVRIRPLLDWTGSEKVNTQYRSLYTHFDEIINSEAKLLVETSKLIQQQWQF